jgi:MFS family permease
MGMAYSHTTRTRPARLLAVLLIAPFMAQADATIANVAAPSIHADLHTTGAELELVIGAYLIAFAVLLITGARLGHTHGYRRVFLLGVGVFTGASLLCALAPGPIALIAFRAVQGAGAALMFPQALTGIQLTFQGAERARAIGLYAVALSIGAVAGQVLGGVIVSADVLGSDWRSIFFVNVPVGVAVIAAGARHLPRESAVERAPRRVDVAGVVTLSAAVLLVVVPLVLGRAEGWPAWTWLSLAASVPAFAGFVAAERRVRMRGGTPLVSLDAMAARAVSSGMLAVAAATSTYYGLLFTLALYLQQGLGRSSLVSGLTLVSWVVAFGVAGQIVRRLPPRLGPLAAPAGCLLLAGAYVALSASLFAGRHAEALLVVLLGAGGLGLGTQFSALIVHLTNAVSDGYAHDISGVTTTTTTIAGAIAIAAFGTAYLSLASAGSATHAFAIVTAGFAAIAGLAALLAHGATRRRAVT